MASLLLDRDAMGLTGIVMSNAVGEVIPFAQLLEVRYWKGHPSFSWGEIYETLTCWSEFVVHGCALGDRRI